MRKRRKEKKKKGIGRRGYNIYQDKHENNRPKSLKKKSFIRWVSEIRLSTTV